MRHILPAAVFAAFFPVTAAAQDTGNFFLGQMILSGGLTPVEQAAFGRSVSVVTAEEIQNRGLRTVQDALRALPGVSISSSGQNFTQIRIRGGEARHTRILIDGIPAAGGDAEYFLSGLETANIERIEVLRGPQSVFFGASATTGVVNIITKRGEVGRQASASIEAGGGLSTSLFASQRGERGGLSLSLSRDDDKGWDYSGSGGQKDGTLRRTAVLSGDFKLTDDLTLGFSARRALERYDFDATNWAAASAQDYVVDDPTLFTNTQEFTGTIYAEYAPAGSRFAHRLSYEATRFARAQGGGVPTRERTEALKYRLSIGIDGSADSANHLVNLLLEDQKDSSSADPTNRRKSRSVALEYRGDFESGLSLQGGLRYSRNDPFPNSTTYTLGASYTFDNGVRVHASAGKGVSNPSYFNLYANAWGFVGNPNLQPEHSRSYDIGVEFPIFSGRGVMDVTYFNEVLKGEIVPTPPPAPQSFVNRAGQSTRRGIEVQGTLAATDNLDLSLSYTHLRAREPAGIEIRRPRHELGLGATLRAFEDRATFTANLRHVAGNYDDQFFGAFLTKQRLPNISTIDISARYDITNQVALTGRITNLTNSKKYETWGYAPRPRTAYVGLNARW